MKKLKAWTDYPMKKSEEGKRAPVREIEVVGYDGNKYCSVKYAGKTHQIKSGYIYKSAGRIREVGSYRHGELCKIFGVDYD